MMSRDRLDKKRLYKVFPLVLEIPVFNQEKFRYKKEELDTQITNKNLVI